MKTYKLKSPKTVFAHSTNKEYILYNEATSQYNLTNTVEAFHHKYLVPYERNDLYYLLEDEMDPRTPSKNLEPASGMHLYADVDFEYNYYSKGYEAVGRPELNYFNAWAPSLNLWLLHEAYSSPESTITLDSNYQYAYDTTFVGDGNRLESLGILSRDYFDVVLEHNYDMKYGQILPDFDKGIPGLNNAQFINKEIQHIYSDRRNVREAFPMFTKFMLTGVEKSEFCTLLEQASLDDDFIQFIGTTGGLLKPTANWEVENGAYQEKSGSLIVYTYDEFLSWLENQSQFTMGLTTTGTTSSSSTETTCEYFESFIKSILVKRAIDSFISNHSYGHIFPIAFKLTIKDVTADLLPSPKHSKTYYFFNYDDMLEFRHYHTQAFYRHEYHYDLRVINGLITYCKTSEEKELIFTEEPYYSEEIKILDSPPIAPDVELITYRGVDNKLLIMLNQMIDKKLAVPIIINESDQSIFEEQYKAQNIQEGLPIMFESDDPTDFQIFKCLKHPVSYDDFRNEHFLPLSSGDPKMTAASYVDTIVPNQAYYYMFRAEDVHGNISNPSPIYEFILNKEGETLYPRIRIVDFAQPEPPTQKTKTFKKYLKIGFSPRQYQIPSDQIQNINSNLVNSDVDIGIADTDNIIGSGRVFKFRIRSKNTGKLIDINVTFKKNKVIKA